MFALRLLCQRLGVARFRVIRRQPIPGRPRSHALRWVSGPQKRLLYVASGLLGARRDKSPTWNRARACQGSLKVVVSTILFIHADPIRANHQASHRCRGSRAQETEGTHVLLLCATPQRWKRQTRKCQ
ncbi:hypothetical protein OH76DRAFT_1093511 [Lentinus brumalis]|uniref:Uncharacterized protein n=1 Tax=Lentinus brumalis TaxID=2498619 RepID=A0A371CW06_9APHY|nr:hypothetical protein OH76DRAFT_1093511 [Polyporus brumalis]